MQVYESILDKISGYIDYDMYIPNSDQNVKYDNKNRHKCPYTVLSWACEFGHDTIVDMIFHNNQQRKILCTTDTLFNINLFERTCKGGHVNIGKMLINNIGTRWFVHVPSISYGYYEYTLTSRASTPLSVACQYGLSELVDFLLTRSDRGDTYVMYHHKYQLPFIEACAGGHAEIVGMFLDRWCQGDYRINPFAYDCEAFRKACENGHINIARMIIARIRNMCVFYDGYDICTELCSDFRWDVCMFALPLACLHGHAHVVEFLLFEVLVLLNSTNEMVVPVVSLFNACAGGHLSIVKLLIKSKLLLFNIQEKPCIAVENACRHGMLNVVQFLIDYNDSCGDYYFDPSDNASNSFVEACSGGHEDIVRYLLHIRVNKAYSNICANSLNNLAFRMACANGHENIARMLLSLNDMYPADQSLRINPSDEENDAFVRACENGHESIIDMLFEIEKMYPMINPGSSDNYALFMACSKGHVNIVKKLIQRMDDGDTRIKLCSGQNRAFIVSCMSRKCIDVFDVFLKRIKSGDKSINHIFSNSMAIIEALSIPPICGRPSRTFRELWKMAMNGEIEIDLSAQNNKLFRVACELNLNDVARVLLKMMDEGRVRMNPGDENNAAFIHVCENGNYEMADILLTRARNGDVRINPWDNKNKALYCACMKGHANIVKLLYEFNEGSERIATECNYALHIACNNGYVDIVCKLFDIYERNNICFNTEVCFYDMLKSACRQGCYDVTAFLVKKLTNMQSFSHNLICGAFKHAIKGCHYDVYKLLQHHVAYKSFNAPGPDIIYKINKIVDSVLKSLDIEMIHLLLASICEEKVPFRYYKGNINIYNKLHIHTHIIPVVMLHSFVRKKIKNEYYDAEKSPRTEWILRMRRIWIDRQSRRILHILGRLHTWKIYANICNFMPCSIKATHIVI